MKKLLYLTWMLLIPVITFANVNDHNIEINGKWISVEYGEAIRIQDWRQGIKVNDSYTNKWIKYRRDGKRRFISDCGRTIKVLDERNIAFKNGRLAPAIIFRRAVLVVPNYSCGVGNNITVYEHGRVDDHIHNRNSNYNGRGIHNNIKNLEGLYYNDHLRHEFILLEDRNGIKTKIKGDSEWHFYRLTKQRGEVYVDRIGNQIRRTDSNEIEWRGTQGGVQVLRKISNNPF